MPRGFTGASAWPGHRLMVAVRTAIGPNASIRPRIETEPPPLMSKIDRKPRPSPSSVTEIAKALGLVPIRTGPGRGPIDDDRLILEAVRLLVAEPPVESFSAAIRQVLAPYTSEPQGLAGDRTVTWGGTTVTLRSKLNRLRERYNADPQDWHRRVRELDEFEAKTTARLQAIKKEGADVRLSRTSVTPRQIQRLKGLRMEEIVPQDLEERAEILTSASRKLT